VLHYQWQRDGVDIARETTTFLYVHPTRVADNAATFKAVVTNPYGSATSNTVALTVSTTPLPPLITGQPLPISVQVGAAATFAVVAVSQGGSLSYQWRRNGGPIIGATGTTYTTPPTIAGDNGTAYSVLVSSSNGTSASLEGLRLLALLLTGRATTATPHAPGCGAGRCRGTRAAPHAARGR
jgi:beta-galactosidase